MGDDKKSGILRVDTSPDATLSGSGLSLVRRKSSGSSLFAKEPTSPSPSVDRLSVTFKMDDGMDAGTNKSLMMSQINDQVATFLKEID